MSNLIRLSQITKTDDSSIHYGREFEPRRGRFRRVVSSSPGRVQKDDIRLSDRNKTIVARWSIVPLHSCFETNGPLGREENTIRYLFLYLLLVFCTATCSFRFHVFWIPQRRDAARGWALSSDHWIRNKEPVAVVFTTFERRSPAYCGLPDPRECK